MYLEDRDGIKVETFNEKIKLTITLDVVEYGYVHTVELINKLNRETLRDINTRRNFLYIINDIINKTIEEEIEEELEEIKKAYIKGDPPPWVLNME